MSEDTEKQLIGALMINNSGIFKVSKIIGPHHFVNDTHGLIFIAICTLLNRGFIANPVTLKRLFEDERGTLDAIGGAKYLAHLAGCAAKMGDVEDLAREMRTAWYHSYLNSDDWKEKRRRVMDRCGGLCEGCRDDSVVQIHHLTYAHCGDELLYELVGLCKACHEKAHGR